MEAMRDAWTDPRLDDLNHRVDSGFEETTREFQAVRLEMRTEFAAVRSEIGSLRAETGAELRGMRSEMAALNRTVLQVGAGAIATLIVGFTAILVQI
ncbi:MAG: hypothetical protein WA862_10775 [Solirubrobacterales bacterium]